MLDKEIEFFNKSLAEWLKTNRGQIALVKDETLVGFFPDEISALTEGARQFGSEPGLVRRVEEQQPVIQSPAYTWGLLSAAP
jgi:hypothetical protein